MGKRHDRGEIPKRKDENLPKKKDEPKNGSDLQEKLDKKSKEFNELQQKYNEEKKKSTQNAADLAKALAEKADLLKKLSASEASEKKLRADLDAVKKAEDEACIVVRLHECRGGMSKVTLASEYPVTKIVPCNMLEHDCGEAIEGAAAEFEIRPFESKTYKLFF